MRSGSDSSSPPLPPNVSVSLPVQREITEYAEYTGRTAATDSVNVRGRAFPATSRRLTTRKADVDQGAVLYEIDPRPYEAALKQAQAQVALQEAQLKYHEAVYQRNLRLSKAARPSAREDVQQAARRSATSPKPRWTPPGPASLSRSSTSNGPRRLRPSAASSDARL